VRLIAPAVENALLEERLYASAREMDVADQVARIITDTPNIDEVYERFSLEVKRLVDFDRININVINPDGDTFAFKYVSGPLQPGRRAGDVVPLENSQTQKVMATGKTLVRCDVAADPRFRGDETIVKMGIHSTMLAPLFCKGRVFGNLSLRSRRVGAFGPREQAILERLAGQIAPAIESALLYEQMRCLDAEKTSPGEHGSREAGPGAAGTALGTLVDNIALLSPQQKRVLELLAQGSSNWEIADALTISPNTVKFHMSSVLGRLKARNRTEAALAWRASEK
jgi:DNA-binding CsgD family transcriptional regulator